jgi:SRSO17 transposase
MTGGSVEAALEEWASSLRDVKGRIRPLFQQERMAASAELFLDALLGPERRKTGWMRAEAAGDPGPWRQQALLGRATWDADALRDVVQDYAVETLAEPDAVLVVDETGFLKQGKASCGVGRQYTASAGKFTSCQIGVFAAYVSGKRHAFIDRALYLPKVWADDRTRRAAAHVPEAVTFATKPQLARAMIERSINTGVPFAWVAADSIYAWARSRWRCAERGRAMYWGSAERITSTRGSASPRSPAPPRRSQRSSILLLGSACQPARAPRVSACTSGPTASSPTWKPVSTTRACQGCGRAGS